MKKENHVQTIYINIDDSGKLTKNEKIAVYGGIVFLSKQEKDKFITQYKSIVSDIKCHYCKEGKSVCLHRCPELKSNNLLPSHNRRLFNYMKHYFVISCVIENQKVYGPIIQDKASKGRFLDYALRRLIKDTVKKLVEEKKIDPYLPVSLVINIDEQTTKSNGYYDLKEGIREELLHGISNYDYGTFHPPILFHTLTISLKYQKSDKSYVIQAADLIAGRVRRTQLQSIQTQSTARDIDSYLNYHLFLP